MTDSDAQHHAGIGLVRSSVLATGALAVSGSAAATLPDTFAVPYALLSGLLFAGGSVAYVWAYLIGLARSRTQAVTLSGLFFLSGGAAPAEARRRLWLAVLGQSAVVVAAGMVRPYTEVAYGILAPMFGMGIMALWGARHGAFPPRAPRS